MLKRICIVLLSCRLWHADAQPPQLILPKGHSDFITAVAVSPACAADPAGGQFFLTGSSDNTAKLWDRSGHEVLTFIGHKFPVNSAAFSPDGQSVLTGSFDGTATLWNLNGRPIRTFGPHENYVYQAIFSPDGKSVLTGSKDGTARLWDIASGNLIRSLTVGQPVSAAAFSPDGKTIVTGCEDGSIQLWRMDSGARKDITLSKHNGKINTLVFSPEGNVFLTACKDGIARIWDIKKGNFIPLQHTAEVTGVAISPDGKSIATADLYGVIRRWDDKGALLTSFQAHTLEIRALCFSPAGSYDPAGGALLVSAGADREARAWNRSNRLSLTMKGHTTPVNTLVFSSPKDHHEEFFLISSLKTGATQRWNLTSNEMHASPGISTPATCRTVSPDGRLSILGDETGKVLRVDNNGVVGNPFVAESPVLTVACSADGRFVAGCTDVNTVFIWDTTGKLVHNFTPLTEISVFALSADGRYVVTGGMDGAVRVWDSDGVPIYERPSNFIKVTSVASSPVSGSGVDDIPLIIWGDSKGQVNSWEPNKDIVKNISNINSVVNSVAFSPNGRTAASGHDNGAIKLWDISKGKELASLVALDSVEWVVTSPSGLFDASPNAMNLMYYVQDLRVIELEQLKRYWEPGLLSQIIKDKPLRDVSAFGVLNLPPDIEAGIDGNLLKIRLKETERSGGLGKLSLLINHKEVAAQINPDKKTALEIDLRQYNEYFLDSNVLTLRAYIAGEGWLRGQDYNLPYVPAAAAKGTGTENAPSAASGTAGPPSLYAVVIGTSNYNNPKMKLRFPDHDAEVMAGALTAAGGSLFPGRVNVQILSTATGKTLSDKKNIRAAFEAVIPKIKAQDILIVYFSGHGLTYGPVDNSQFYYLTKDIRDAEALPDAAQRTSYAVSSAEITGWLKSAKAQKQILIFDACNSGSFAGAFEANSAKDLSPSDIRAYDEMKDVTGTYILAGAAADKVSFEASQYGQGLLTYSLLEGMNGLALLPDRRVDVMRLFQYADKRVEYLAKDIDKVQKPILAFPKGSSGSSGESFSIGKLDAAAQAKMPGVNPVKLVFIKSRFVNVDPGGEELDIDQAMDDYMANEVALGADAPFVFIPVDRYAHAYKISGNYAIQGDQVVVKAAIRKGDFVKTFSAAGSRKDLRKLAENMYNEMAQLIPQE